MNQADFSAAVEIAAPEISTDTRELAVELAEPKIDSFRVRWLIEDCGADVMRAMTLARLDERDLARNPSLRPLGLHRYLHTRH
ncbi:MAG: hypothetical protein KGQ70_08940, partial [Alphaproteobacteria bacterium]|nr:hypothetical protein [Alphaproteobacteria bacterium]